MFFAHSYAKIKVDSYEFLSLEKALTIHNIMIPLKSIFSKYKYNDSYNKFLEKYIHYLLQNSNNK